MALHAGAHVAREAVRHVLVLVGHAPPHRHHVTHPSVFGVDRGEDVIEQRALVIIRVVGVGVEREQPPGELEHVVHVAGLARASIDAVAQAVRRTVILVGAVASRGEAVVLGDRVPEEPGCQKIGGAAGVDVALHGAEQLGNLRVRMLATEVVLMALERLDEGAVLEGMREPQPALVTGVGVQIDQHLVHAAELGVQHSLYLAVVQGRQRPIGPAGKLRLDGERRPVTCVAVRVAQARERLVQGIPGRPQPVQVEGRRLDLAPRQSGEGLSPAFQGAQVTIAVLVLHDL